MLGQKVATEEVEAVITDRDVWRTDDSHVPQWTRTLRSSRVRHLTMESCMDSETVRKIAIDIKVTPDLSRIELMATHSRLIE